MNNNRSNNIGNNSTITNSTIIVGGNSQNISIEDRYNEGIHIIDLLKTEERKKKKELIAIAKKIILISLILIVSGIILYYTYSKESLLTISSFVLGALGLVVAICGTPKAINAQNKTERMYFANLSKIEDFIRYNQRDDLLSKLKEQLRKR